MLFTNISDVDLQTLSYIDDDELENICKVNPYAQNLCRNDKLWELKLTNTFPEFPLRKYKINPKKIYKLLRFGTRLDVFIFFITHGYINLAGKIIEDYPNVNE